MKYLINYKDFAINEAISKGVKDKLTIKFKSEREDLTDAQIEYYLDEFDKYKGSSKVIEKDITKYSFAELEKLIDSFPKKVNRSLTGLNNLSQEDIVYNENNLLILKGDTKEKCIRYGKGYTWCISRTDASNMFNTYRYRYDEINFYFIFDKDKPDTDDNRSLVLLIDKNGKYYLANASNSGDFAGTKEFSYDEICKFQPKLKELKSLFKPLPLTPKEKEIYNKIKNEIPNDNLLEAFGSYEIVEAYISNGSELTDNQYSNLTDDLKSKYINLGNDLSDNQLSITSNKLKERYYDLHSLESWLNKQYSKEEQLDLTELDCSSKNITSLKGIENLINLTHIILSYNNLTSIKGVENLTNLIALDCKFNKIKTIKDNIPDNILYLDLSHNGLESFDGIEKLINLKILYCFDNKLKNLKFIENLYNLEDLDISNNELYSLDGIEKLVNLIKIDLSRNKINNLKGIEKLIKLEVLTCNSINLTSLHSIENLINLEYLFSCNNKLNSLHGIEKLKKLKKINCNNNTPDINKKYNINKILNTFKNGEIIKNIEDYKLV